MTNAVVLEAVNIVMLVCGFGGFVAYLGLEHVYHRHVSGWMLLALIGVSLALVLFGAGVWNDGVDLVPVRALAATCLVLAEIGLVRETVTASAG